MLISFSLSELFVLSLSSAVTSPVHVTELSLEETAEALSRRVLESFLLSLSLVRDFLSLFREVVPVDFSELLLDNEELVFKLELLPARELPPSLLLVLMVFRLLVLLPEVPVPVPVVPVPDCVLLLVSSKPESFFVVFFRVLQSRWRNTG